MEEKELLGWPDFEEELNRLEALRKELSGESNSYVSQLLFRGQSNAKSWKLKSTLERYTKKDKISALEYFQVINRVAPQIETYTDKCWEVNYNQFEKWNNNPGLLLLSTSLPNPEYLVYLRHHGFPSPLLDWTRSPFIAGYFAFNTPPEDAAKVAIYAYIEWAGQGKTQSGRKPVISTVPANVRSHKRHFVQQSEYTICVDKTLTGVIFSNHEKAFFQTEKDENLLWKFTLPISERINVLKKLDRMNINGLSLFDNEESLMETLALREFYLDNAK